MIFEYSDNNGIFLSFLFTYRLNASAVIPISTPLLGLRMSHNVFSALYAITLFPEGVKISSCPNSYNSFFVLLAMTPSFFTVVKL